MKFVEDGIAYSGAIVCPSYRELCAVSGVVCVYALCQLCAHRATTASACAQAMGCVLSMAAVSVTSATLVKTAAEVSLTSSCPVMTLSV